MLVRKIHKEFCKSEMSVAVVGRGSASQTGQEGNVTICRVPSVDMRTELAQQPQPTKVSVIGMPGHLLTDSMLDAMLDNLPFGPAIVDRSVKESVLSITLSSLSAALECMQHFQGCCWRGNHGRIAAQIEDCAMLECSAPVAFDDSCLPAASTDASQPSGLSASGELEPAFSDEPSFRVQPENAPSPSDLLIPMDVPLPRPFQLPTTATNFSRGSDSTFVTADSFPGIDEEQMHDEPCHIAPPVSLAEMSRVRAAVRIYGLPAHLKHGFMLRNLLAAEGLTDDIVSHLLQGSSVLIAFSNTRAAKTCVRFVERCSLSDSESLVTAQLIELDEASEGLPQHVMMRFWEEAARLSKEEVRSAAVK